jgi:hypothetical protein
MGWRVAGLAPGQSKVLAGTYAGYPSWYANVITQAVVDARHEVTESSEANNRRGMRIRVLRRP